MAAAGIELLEETDGEKRASVAVFCTLAAVAIAAGAGEVALTLSMATLEWVGVRKAPSILQAPASPPPDLGLALG